MYIVQEVNNCRRETGSYPIAPGSPFKAEELIKVVYGIVNRRSTSAELRPTNYVDGTGSYRIVHIAACLPVAYRGKTYAIYTKVTFPPSFPLVPPILSVYNVDEKKFKVNGKYFYCALPDKTYEVKLLSSGYWGQSFDFEVLMGEFCRALAADFPFFKVGGPTKGPSVPVIYDPRYNMPQTIFPFDYQLTRDTRPEQYADGYSTALDDESSDILFGRFESDFTPYRVEDGGSKGVDVKGTLENIKNTMDIDLITCERSLVWLIEQNERLAMWEQKVRRGDARLRRGIKTIEADIRKLDQAYQQHKEQELNETSLHEVILLPDDDKRILKSCLERKGSMDAQLVLEELYIEKESGSWKDALRDLNLLWKREFDARLAFNLRTRPKTTK